MRLLILCLCLACVSMTPPPLPPLPKAKHKIAATEIKGAQLLIAKVIVAPSKPMFPPYYFRITATDNLSQTSLPSNEVSFTNSVTFATGKIKWTAQTITLGWDASISTNRVTNYTVYRGDSPGDSSTNYAAGTNLMLKVPVIRPGTANLTNLVITVMGLGFSWSATNPTGMRLFRGTNMTISARKF